MAAQVDQLKSAHAALATLLKEKNCTPIMVRLAWHDSGTYDNSKKDLPFPQAGGADGSIRFAPEINHGANAGLQNALDLLTPIKDAHPLVSWADLIQMASAVGIEVCGGPKIPMRYGRVDAAGPEQCSPEGNLPAGASPFPKGASAANHLRDVFHRMGFSDQEIVALSGAHTLGRASPTRSGLGKDKTKYTEAGPGRVGGQSWTADWLKFNNSYFTSVKSHVDSELLVLETDACIFTDEGFKPSAEKYAADEAAFFHDYALAHAKLSELGSKFEPAEGIKI